ncbi:hypothetical protein [Kitasatospora aureofaciens]|uniref:hypothetical protein n=1 Tax=Kitasatospora aureofaciens TaxID=1894 RepID=UPI0033E96716
MALVLSGRNVAVGAVMLCSALLLTSCSSSPSIRTTPDPIADARDQAMAAYQAYLDITDKAYAQGSLTGIDPTMYARGSALAVIKVGVGSFEADNLVMKGKPGHSSLEVTSVDLASMPPTVKIQDCYDSTNYVKTDKVTGRILDSDRRRVVEGGVAQRVDGHWLISEAWSDPKRPC